MAGTKQSIDVLGRRMAYVVRGRLARAAVTDQIPGGKGGKGDHGQAVLVACRDQAVALGDGEAGRDGGDAQAEVGNGEEHREHAGSLVGTGKRGDEADAALEAGAEADSGERGPGKKARHGGDPEGE